jgi:orotate phosphoribosyltransferase
MLLIKATTFKKLKEEPYKWACGMSMRIYNDNRMLLGNFNHRKMIADGFINLIKQKNIHPDFIIGTVTSGIAPAASVAQFLGKKLLINHEGNYFLYPAILYEKKLVKQFKNYCDIVITNSPMAIPYGIQYANQLGVSFAYMRTPKDHGKKLPIEGIVKEGMRFIFMHTYEDSVLVEQSKSTLEEDYKLFSRGSLYVGHAHYQIHPEDITGDVSVVVEDLLSTGGSAALEVYKARKFGLICNGCFSIFSYGFDCLKKQFSGENEIGDKGIKLSLECKIDSLLTFPTLMEVIKEKKFYPKETIRAMEAENATFDERYTKFLSEKNKTEI